MRKLCFLFGIFVFSVADTAIAEHTTVLNAANLLINKIPNARHDESSVTLQGNLFSISTMAAGFNSLNVSSGTTFVKLDAPRRPRQEV